jgi:hypothetical protein
MKKTLIVAIIALCSAVAVGQVPSYTPNLQLQIPAYGQQNWQVPMNYNFNRLDLFLSGGLPLPNLTVTGALQATGLSTWGSTTTYSAGNTVIFLGTIYQSLTNANVGNVPNTSTSNWTTTLGGGSGGGASVTLEHVFSSAGTFNYVHTLNSLYPQATCYVNGGGATISLSPVDVNTMAVTAGNAADVVCAFTATPAPAAIFNFAVTPNTTTFVPSMSGTQTPTFAIAQSGSSGYSGTVTYSTTGLASGMTGAYSPTTITATGTSTLTVSFPSTQTAGLTTFHALGTDGVNSVSQPVALTISDINTGMVNGWNMNEGTGTSFLDKIASDNMTTTGITWGSVAGFPGSIPTFNGTSSHAAGANTNPGFTASSPFTLCLWAQPTGVSTFQLFLDSSSAGSTNGIAFYVNVSRLYLNIFGTPTSNLLDVYTTITTPVSPTFYCATYDGSTHAAGVTFYINAIPQTNAVSADTLSGTVAGTTMYMGAAQSGTGYYAGPMAFVRIWNVLKTGTQISNYYAAGPK